MWLTDIHRSTLNPLTTSEQGLKMRQKDVIQNQDDMILEIEKGVSKIHQQVCLLVIYQDFEVN